MHDAQCTPPRVVGLKLVAEHQFDESRHKFMVVGRITGHATYHPDHTGAEKCATMFTRATGDEYIISEIRSFSTLPAAEDAQVDFVPI